MSDSERARRFDAVVVVALLIACEMEVIAHEVDRETRNDAILVAGVLAIAATVIPLWWRRVVPLLSTVASMAGLLMLLTLVRDDASMLNIPQLVLFIVPYSVAQYSERKTAIRGLVVCLVAIGAANVITHSDAPSWTFSIGASSASWLVGRFLHGQRSLAAALERTSGQIVSESEGRERLAVAEQRTRIARELQTLVANNVSTMIVQAQAAQRFLEMDDDQADGAMESIEQTGRAALSEMRLILGVLRRANQPADLAPQPGIGQIPQLIDDARRQHRQIALRVDGDPGPLPASVDLGVYRILQDAIATRPDTELDVSVAFSADHIDLRICAPQPVTSWPSVAMRERVVLCEGELSVDSAGTEQTLAVRLPTVLRGALA